MEQTNLDSGVNRNKHKLTYAYANYVDGGGLYIEALEDGEFYTELTVNLYGYGIVPEKNQVIMPVYKMDPELVLKVKNDLVKRVIKRINYGPFDAYGELVELKDDWEKRIASIESLMPHEADEDD